MGAGLVQERLTLRSGQWYAWQMMPGYTGVPYCSPIRVERCEALRTGQSRMRLAYLNAAYAQGVQDFDETLRVLVREKDYIVAVREEGDATPQIRTAIISVITWEWMQIHFCSLVDTKRGQNPETRNDSLFAFLDRIYLG